MDLKKILNEKHSGFMGRTHFLLTTAMFLGLWLLPRTFPVIGEWSFRYISSIRSDYLFVLVIFMVMAGAACAPDIDSNPIEEGGSAIIYQLGILGQILSLIAVTVTHVIWSVAHLKGDKRPKSAHRLFFHSLILPLITYFWINMTLTDSKRIMTITKFNLDYIDFYVIVFLVGICVFIGANMSLYKPLGLLGLYRYVNIICIGLVLLSMSYFLYKPIFYLKIAAQTMCIAYAAHNIEDIFTQGGAPLLFPIPLPGNILGGAGSGNRGLQLWFNNWIPFPLLIKTGGIVNTILDYSMSIIDVWLLYIVFF